MKKKLSKQELTLKKLAVIVQSYIDDAGYLKSQNLRLSNNYEASPVSLYPAKNDYFETAIAKLHRAIRDIEIVTIIDSGHDYVEIGGIKWATMNLGATDVTDSGMFYQWADIQGYSASEVGNGENQKPFDWEDYKYGNGTDAPGNEGMSKYNDSDGKTNVDVYDDPVTSAWGEYWRLPTTEEFATLDSSADAEWTNNFRGSGVPGLIYTDKEDSNKVLFFPAAGYAHEGAILDQNYMGRYWSSTLSVDQAQYGLGMYFAGSNVELHSNHARSMGNCVRGVYTGLTSTRELGTTITQQERIKWNNKADANAVYTKAEANEKFATKADMIDNEEVIATSLTSLDSRVSTLENKTDIPTLLSEPTESTSTYTVGTHTKTFVLDQLCKVPSQNIPGFFNYYRLHSISNGRYKWKQDKDNMYVPVVANRVVRFISEYVSVVGRDLVILTI